MNKMIWLSLLGNKYLTKIRKCVYIVGCKVVIPGPIRKNGVYIVYSIRYIYFALVLVILTFKLLT